MPAFHAVSRFIWLIFIGISFMNALAIRRRASVRIEKEPMLAKGYESLLLRYLIVTNLPWVAMGFACTIGGVPSVWSFFRPRDGNPYVLAWFALVLVLWVYDIYWILFDGGAAALAKHPGAYRISLSHEWKVKLLCLACIAGGVAGAVMAWNLDITQLPQ